MARIETRGQNNWNARTGYQYRQRVAGPIEPMERGGLLALAARVFAKQRD